MEQSRRSIAFISELQSATAAASNKAFALTCITHNLTHQEASLIIRRYLALTDANVLRNRD